MASLVKKWKNENGNFKIDNIFSDDDGINPAHNLISWPGHVKPSLTMKSGNLMQKQQKAKGA